MAFGDVQVGELLFATNPRSEQMTARARRVVWTVPGAASDPPDTLEEGWISAWPRLILNTWNGGRSVQ